MCFGHVDDNKYREAEFLLSDLGMESILNVKSSIIYYQIFENSLIFRLIIDNKKCIHQILLSFSCGKLIIKKCI